MPIVVKHKILWQLPVGILLGAYIYVGFKLADYTILTSNASVIPFTVFMLPLALIPLVSISDSLSGMIERMFKKVIIFEENMKEVKR